MKLFQSKKEKRLNKLKKIIEKAAQELKSSELTYFTEWIFTLPSQDIKVGDCSLHHDYDLPSGIDGFGLNDLNMLCKEGFLEKVSEEDPQTLEKEIKYKIKLELR